MEFRKYQHIERLGTSATDGILDGQCTVFYKIDGTNASVWLDKNGNLCAGSRKRQLSLQSDNAGFFAYVQQNQSILNYLRKHPAHRLYGEWLVPHSLRTYRDEAWRHFYIFDVIKERGDDTFDYLPYSIYQPMLEEFALDYIPPLAVINNPTNESLYKLLDKTGQFLVKNGSGKGEGIVIKNYEFFNRYGRQNWAKIVANEFKEKHHKEMGAPEINTKQSIEQKIVDKYCTEAFVEKEFSKIVNDNGGDWESKMIPRLLNTVYHELVAEESWNFVKKFKYPVVDYRELKRLVNAKVKQTKKDVFY